MGVEKWEKVNKTKKRKTVTENGIHFDNIRIYRYPA